LHRPVDWFSSLGIVAIILTVLALVAYTMSERPPSTSKMRLPRLGGAAPTATN
jgi:Na+-transporting methylmalonyl-CoA/oxaloacetate decarboxylase gamma subunit